MKKLIIIICILAAVSLASVGITKVLNPQEASKDDTFTIVTSFYPTYIATKNVANGIDGVEVVNLTENHSGCLHDYQLTTNDMRKLEGADVFVMNGGGMEEFIEDVVAKYPDLTVIDASTGIALLEPTKGHHHDHAEDMDDHAEDEHEHDHEEDMDDHEEDEHDHEHEANAHVWMDPVRYMTQIENITAGLKKADAGHTNEYEANQKTYLKKVEGIKEQFDALKDKQHTSIITFHEAFSYLANYLGYDVVYCMDLDDEFGLSAGEIAEVIDEIQKHDVRVLFTETQYKDSIATNISTETDAKTYVLTSLTADEDDLDAYLNGMQKNIDVLKSVFAE